MITFWIADTPSNAAFWTPVIYFAGRVYLPPTNLPLSKMWSPLGAWAGTLEMRVIIYDAYQNVIGTRDSNVTVSGDNTYVFFWNAGYWVKATEPSPPPPPPPPPEELYIWADIQPSGAGQVSGVSWVEESGALKAGPFPYGKTITLTAVPAEGYNFGSWVVNDEYAGANRSLTIMITTTLYIRVAFSEVVVPPPPPSDIWYELFAMKLYLETQVPPPSPEELWHELFVAAVHLEIKTVASLWQELYNVSLLFELVGAPPEPPEPPEPPLPPSTGAFPWDKAAAAAAGVGLLVAATRKKGGQT